MGGVSDKRQMAPEPFAQLSIRPSDVTRLPRFREKALDVTINKPHPQLQNTLLRNSHHMPLTALAEVLKHEPTITMSRHTPARVFMHNTHVSVLAIGRLKLVIKT